jgi:hypothetical protein
MCSDTHLSALAHAIVRMQVRLHGTPSEPLGDVETRIYRTLHAANVASLDERYPGDTSRDVPRFAAYARTVTAPMTVLKLCHSYAYQACEARTWEACEAKKLIDALESYTIRELPGYEQAPWSI